MRGKECVLRHIGVSESLRRSRSLCHRGGAPRLLRRLALLLLSVATLLSVPAGASGGPNVPGDPTPPEVTPVRYGTLGANGWYVSNVTLNWIVHDPESVILEEHGCDATTLVADTVGASFTCSATSDGGVTTKTVTIRRDAT